MSSDFGARDATNSFAVQRALLEASKTLRKGRIYDTLRQYYYWAHMPQNVHAYILQCKSCRRHRPFDKRRQLLMLSPPSGPLEFIAIDILGPLTRTKQANWFIIGITDRFKKLTRVIPISSITALQVAMEVVEDEILPYGIPKDILANNGYQFTSKVFAALCASLRTKQETTTEYHLQCNGQVEWYCRKLATRLPHYKDEHQQDWDIFIKPLTYAYNTPVHRTTGMPPFSFTQSSKSPGVPETYWK